MTKQFYIVVDFEATCWPDQSRKGDGEIIQFGCVRMDARSRRILDVFSSHVRPVRYPYLSEFCIALTGIQQKTVDAAPPFRSVLADFVDWLGDPSIVTFCSWGALDRFLLRDACRFHRLDFPFDDDYINIKPAFSDCFSGRGVSMQRALEILDLEPTGNPHNALDDAGNVARIWQHVLLERQ